MRSAWVMVAVVVVVLIGGAAFLVVGDDQAAGEPTPDVAVEGFDGTEATLADLHDDRPMVVNFYASWCPPCVAEMRDAFGPVDRDLPDVDFLGVALQDDPEAALAVAEETAVDYDLVQDPRGELYQALELAAMPATVYVDADGGIVGAHNGALTRGQLEEQIAEHLTG